MFIEAPKCKVPASSLRRSGLKSGPFWRRYKMGEEGCKFGVHNKSAGGFDSS